ncbi:hypothetical protein SAMN02745134_01290 [Clostridium acidisoli DSM 12555]|uniref:Uncharacterized protein n=1 Tax=Clostridium acidisoli DSM 12555 TaxID=1121291 RepID=A0A1W1XD61_9CLOT|nr:hypothetical protein [Clostridium acidisoli]SMC21431.1 hypothetical protein SAMN02745134_01290 [Clostridium acidisoli DSM 12555]
MNLFDSISPDELTLLSSIIAIAISKGKSPDDINVLGNFITNLGASLLTIAAQEQYLNSKEEKRKQIIDLENQIDNLKKELG